MRASQARSSSRRARCQREHRLQVADLLEPLETGAAPTRWVGESGVTQLGMLRLERRSSRIRSS